MIEQTTNDFNKKLCLLKAKSESSLLTIFKDSFGASEIREIVAKNIDRLNMTGSEPRKIK